MVKSLFIRILAWKLKKIAQLIIWKYRPGVIGVTGSVGKTSTKLAIAAVLQSERAVRASSGNFNTELGLPLTVISSHSDLGSFLFWPRVIVEGLTRLLVRTAYPEILVLEYAADRPGDIKRLLEIARPNVSVITAIGEVPVHVEHYNGPEEVMREKARLIEQLPASGFAILNADDPTMRTLGDRTRAHLITYGFNKDAEVRVTNYEVYVAEGRPRGIVFKLEYGGSFVPVRLEGIFGKTQASAAAAAAAVGIIFGLNLVKISEALKTYRSGASRMQLIPGVEQSLILDDCYNASPLSMKAALETLEELPAKRRVGVLGDMAELGVYAADAHESVGRRAARVLDLLVTVGPRAQLIAQVAQKSGLNRRHIHSFSSVNEAKGEMKKIIKKGDVVLVKASHAVGLEKIVEEIKAF